MEHISFSKLNSEEWPKIEWDIHVCSDDIIEMVPLPAWDRKKCKPDGWTVNPQLRFGLTVHPEGLQFFLSHKGKDTIFFIIPKNNSR